LPFVGRTAWRDLEKLNSFGPKVVGTEANEVLAVNFLNKRLLEIQSKVHANQNVTLDHQVASGSFFLGFKPYGMVSAYRSIQNLVARIEGESREALLINCHFDSVPGSPGAGDDCANCAIMLELLEVLASRGEKNKHSIVFLFNGAEEGGLLGECH